MNNKTKPSEPTPDYSVLFGYGELLDAADAGMSDISVTQYQTVSQLAREFIGGYWGDPSMERQCRRSGALQDMFEDIERQALTQATQQRLRDAQRQRIGLHLV